ncbi:MAG: hypothetical protein IPK72_04800 [Candidatus Eisenbacteria bacterium]|nr:hypothetical protein [Candidatus Eisenbacteria bacterium]
MPVPPKTSPALSAISLLIAAGCGGGDSSSPPPVIPNNPPTIERVYTLPARVHAAEEVVALVNARDRDGDRLKFRWEATRGEFPDGNVLAGSTWATPRARGRDTLYVHVSDAVDSVVGKVEVDLVLPAPPDSVSLVNASSLFTLSWQKSRDHGITHWAGYEVFVADRSLVGLSEAELLPYRLYDEPWTAPELTTRVSRLRDGRPLRIGTKYYAHVRSLRRWDGLDERSLPSAELDLSPRPDWILAVFPERRHLNGGLALDLSAGRARLLDPGDASGLAERDIYLDGGREDGTGPLEMRSVSLLAGDNPAWGARVCLLKRIAGEPDVSTTSDDGWSTTVAVETGAVYALKTPEGNYAKLSVTSVAGFAPNRHAHVSWAYQTIPGYRSF